MDQQQATAWFSTLSLADKTAALLIVMFSFTLTVRDLKFQFSGDCEQRWNLAYHLSEINHALTSAAWAHAENRSTYSDGDLMAIIFQQDRYPELAAECAAAVMLAHDRIGNRVERLRGSLPNSSA